MIVLRYLGEQCGLGDVSNARRGIGVSHEDPVELLSDGSEQELLAALNNSVVCVISLHDRVVVLVNIEEAHETLTVLLRANILANRATRAVGVCAWLALRISDFN